MKYENGEMRVMGKDVVNDIPDMLSEENQVDETLMNLANDAVAEQENDRKHYDSLTRQAMAMTREEQEATARGLHPIVMMREIENTLVLQEEKISRVQGVLSNE